MKKFKKLFPSRAAMLLLMTMLTSIGTWAAPAPPQFPTTSGGSGTSEDPYKISSTSDLNQLAEDVNNGITYQDVYFKLTQNITYSTSGLSETESNYTPIGDTMVTICDSSKVTSTATARPSVVSASIGVETRMPTNI